jgi:hypothetical protein
VDPAGRIEPFLPRRASRVEVTLGINFVTENSLDQFLDGRIGSNDATQPSSGKKDLRKHCYWRPPTMRELRHTPIEVVENTSFEVTHHRRKIASMKNGALHCYVRV